MKLFLSNTTNFDQSKKSIALQTSKGNDIDNYQIEELSRSELTIGEKLNTETYPLLRFKGQPTPVYNCHGFTFASRRTNIDKSSEIWKILEDDNYIKVSQEHLMVGDVILYVSNDGKGDIQHTGMVVQIDRTMQPIGIFILSKWGKYKEVVHPVFQCFYLDCSIEFWRNNLGYVPAE